MKLRLQAPLHRCRWATATALAVAVAGSPFVVAGAAQAAGSGEVDIALYDSTTGDLVGGQTVTLYSTATGAVVGSPRLSIAGHEVSFTGLEDGGYTAKVSGSAKYHEKYSTVVTVNEDHPDAEAWVELNPITPSNGRISGTITKPGDMVDAEVEIFPADATDASIESGDVQPVASVDYAYGYADGGDEARADWARQLPPGSYKVLVGDDDSPETVHHQSPYGGYDGGSYYYGYDNGWSEHESQVWIGSGASNDADHAKAFTVTAAETTKTDPVALAARVDAHEDGQITGTVTGTAGAALGDVQVTLLQQQEDGSWEGVDSDTTGKDGKFSFTGVYDYDTESSDSLPAGVYTVVFEDERHEYGAEFLGDVPATRDEGVPDEVQTLTLGENDHQVADAALSYVPIDRSSGVYGVVTDDLGKAHAGQVLLYDVYGNYADDLLTRRDGTWAVPATEIAPGQYKAAADDPVDVEGWYGGKSFKTARTVSIPVKGAGDFGNSLLARFGRIGGKISFPTVAGTNTTDAYVLVYDADGDLIDGRQLNDAGTYSFVERPGTYYVAAAGRAYDAFDETPVEVSSTPFIRQFWAGKYTIGTATPIVVGSGATASGVNITLGRTLAATSAPAIVGTPAAGGRLTATDGTWNVGHDVAFAYTWKRNGAVVSHAKTYAVTAADQGTTLTLTVTATDTNLEYATGTANAKPVAVAKPAPVKHHKKKHHKKKHHKKHK